MSDQRNVVMAVHTALTSEPRLELRKQVGGRADHRQATVAIADSQRHGQEHPGRLLFAGRVLFQLVDRYAGGHDVLDAGPKCTA